MRRLFTKAYIGANERIRALLDEYAPGYREAEEPRQWFSDKV